MNETPKRQELIDAEAAADEEAARPSKGRSLAVIAVMTVLVVIAGSAFAWTVLSGGSDDPGLVFVIPAGSSDRIVPELQSAVDVPNDIVFEPGDVAAITVVNEDVVTHRAGPFLVAPGQTFTQRFERPGEYPIACAIDPADSVVVTVTG